MSNEKWSQGKIISEFFGLNPKMYSLVIINNEEIEKAKGVNKNVVKTLDIKNMWIFYLIYML